MIDTQGIVSRNIANALEKGKTYAGLPAGGQWLTIKGAKVYTKNGKVIAGAGGKLGGGDDSKSSSGSSGRNLNDGNYSDKELNDGTAKKGKELASKRKSLSNIVNKVKGDHSQSKIVLPMLKNSLKTSREWVASHGSTNRHGWSDEKMEKHNKEMKYRKDVTMAINDAILEIENIDTNKNSNVNSDQAKKVSKDDSKNTKGNPPTSDKKSDKKHSAEKISKKINEMLHERGINATLGVDDLSAGSNETYHIESKYGFSDKKFDGMSIMYNNGVFEVIESHAGDKGEDMYIHGEYKAIGTALNRMLLGNNTHGGQTPKKVWDNDTSHKGAKTWDEYSNTKSKESKNESSKPNRKVDSSLSDSAKKNSNLDKNSKAPEGYTEKDAKPENYKDAEYKKTDTYKSLDKNQQASYSAAHQIKDLDVSRLTTEEKDDLDDLLSVIKSEMPSTKYTEDEAFEEFSGIVSEGEWGKKKFQGQSLTSIEDYKSGGYLDFEGKHEWSKDKIKAVKSASEALQKKVNEKVKPMNETIANVNYKIGLDDVVDVIGSGIAHGFFNDALNDDIGKQMTKLNEKYNPKVSPDQLRLFKAFEDCFKTLGVNDN